MHRVAARWWSPTHFFSYVLPIPLALALALACTGIYFIKQYAGGLDMFKAWLDWQDKNIGHDQDGFNTMARGSGFRHEDKHLPPAVLPSDATANRYFYAAMHNTTGVSFLPASMFGNTYTYVNARLWEVGTGTGGGAALGGRTKREGLRTCRAGGLRRSSHAYGTLPTCSILTCIMPHAS